MTKCQFKGCDRRADSVCMIADMEGDTFDRDFCLFHLKKMLHDEKDANLEIR